MKFPRCIRLDASDLHVYPQAASPGEWAVPGGVTFAGCDPAALDSKARFAFQNGWLGVESFGWSTFVEVAEIGEAEFERVIETLARGFVSVLGAPDMAAALPPARAEAEYAAGLCDHKLHTLLALERGLGEDDAAEDGIVERFRVIVPERAQDHARIWDIVPDESGGGG